jgi:hypothetical protein
MTNLEDRLRERLKAIAASVTGEETFVDTVAKRTRRHAPIRVGSLVLSLLLALANAGRKR